MGRGVIVTEPPGERLMSLDEWAAMDEDEPGELVDGRLVEEEIPAIPHEAVFGWLFLVLGGWVKLHKGVIFGSEVKYALGPRRGRKPDTSIFLGRRPKLPRRGPVREPPDVVVEIVSPTPRDRRRDRVEKLREYAAFGVRWYWLVDPEARTVEILRLGDQGHYTLLVSASDGAVAVPGLEGLTLDLDALWGELDELLEDEPADPPTPDTPAH